MVVTDHSLQIPTNKEAKPIRNYSGSFTPHYLEKVGDVVDSIFADDFESGDLNLWTSSVTDSGDLSAERYASYWGDYGLSAEINDTNPIYVQDDAPASDAIYLARFYLDPSRLTVGTGSVVTLFSGLGGGSEIFRLQLQKTSTIYQVRIGIKNIGGSWTDGAWKDINTGWTALEMQWVAADDNGYMSLWVDGNASGSVSPVDNGTLLLDSVRLGVLSISGTGTVGTLYFDDFESRRRSNIGLLPEPGVEEPEPVAEPGWDAVQYTYDTQHPHAVTALSSGESYSYDANGNMTQRVENGITWTQTYNAENRLATLSDASTTWAFSYDGDGSRVAQVVTNGTNVVQTKYFAAGAYEETNDGTATTTKKYYSIAGQNIAMDDGSGMKYLLTDHLGSMVGVTDTTGDLISQQRYLPFGEIRQDIGSITQTDFGYISSPSEASGTGQRNLPETGLMDYKARMYSPQLKRFIQPDSIVPGAGSPQSWNRYAYVKNNPIVYNDPSGHIPCNEIENGRCAKEPGWNKKDDIGGDASTIGKTCGLTNQTIHSDSLYQTMILRSSTWITTNEDWNNAKLSTAAEESYGGDSGILSMGGSQFAIYAGVNATSIFNDFGKRAVGTNFVTTTGIIEEREMGNYLKSINVYNGSRTLLGVRYIVIRDVFADIVIPVTPNNLQGYNGNFLININLRLRAGYDSKIFVNIGVIGGVPNNLDIILTYP